MNKVINIIKSFRYEIFAFIFCSLYLVFLHVLNTELLSLYAEYDYSAIILHNNGQPILYVIIGMVLIYIWIKLDFSRWYELQYLDPGLPEVINFLVDVSLTFFFIVMIISSLYIPILKAMVALASIGICFLLKK